MLWGRKWSLASISCWVTRNISLDFSFCFILDAPNCMNTGELLGYTSLAFFIQCSLWLLSELLCRRWILNQKTSEPESRWIDELSTCHKTACKHPNNYYSWSHRLFCVTNIQQRSVGYKFFYPPPPPPHHVILRDVIVRDVIVCDDIVLCFYLLKGNLMFHFISGTGRGFVDGTEMVWSKCITILRLPLHAADHSETWYPVSSQLAIVSHTLSEGCYSNMYWVAQG